MSYRLRQSLCILGIFVCVIVVLVINMYVHAKQELLLAETAYAQEDWQMAIMHYERAIKWYTPFSTPVRTAVQGLWELASVAEKRQDFSLALDAYQSLRSALYAIESWYIPYQEWIPRCDKKIARLMAATPRIKAPEGETQEEAVARFASMLQRQTAPHVGWVVVTEIGFFGWVGATLLFICRAFSSNGILRGRQGLLWGSCIVLFFAVWIVGMLFA